MIASIKTDARLVKASQIEKLIKDEWSIDYLIFNSDHTGAHTEMAYLAYVDREPLTGYEADKLLSFFNDKQGSYMLPILLKYLCNKRLIEEGTYIIDMEW